METGEQPVGQTLGMLALAGQAGGARSDSHQPAIVPHRRSMIWSRVVPSARAVKVSAMRWRKTGGASAITPVPWPADHARIDIGSFRGDFSKAKRVLGWEPRIGLAAGMADTVAFYRARPWYLSST